MSILGYNRAYSGPFGLITGHNVSDGGQNPQIYGITGVMCAST